MLKFRLGATNPARGQGIAGMIPLNNTERLARAVLLFHRGGPWTKNDQEMWEALTGAKDATTKALCELARVVHGQEERKPQDAGRSPA
jgi:hypothetical protein